MECILTSASLGVDPAGVDPVGVDLVGVDPVRLREKARGVDPAFPSLSFYSPQRASSGNYKVLKERPLFIPLK